MRRGLSEAQRNADGDVFPEPAATGGPLANPRKILKEIGLDWIERHWIDRGIQSVVSSRSDDACSSRRLPFEQDC